MGAMSFIEEKPPGGEAGYSDGSPGGVEGAGGDVSASPGKAESKLQAVLGELRVSLAAQQEHFQDSGPAAFDREAAQMTLASIRQVTAAVTHTESELRTEINEVRRLLEEVRCLWNSGQPGPVHSAFQDEIKLLSSRVSSLERKDLVNLEKRCGQFEQRQAALISAMSEIEMRMNSASVPEGTAAGLEVCAPGSAIVVTAAPDEGGAVSEFRATLDAAKEDARRLLQDTFEEQLARSQEVVSDWARAQIDQLTAALEAERDARNMHVEEVHKSFKKWFETIESDILSLASQMPTSRPGADPQRAEEGTLSGQTKEVSVCVARKEDRLAADGSDAVKAISTASSTTSTQPPQTTSTQPPQQISRASSSPALHPAFPSQDDASARQTPSSRPYSPTVARRHDLGAFPASLPLGAQTVAVPPPSSSSARNSFSPMMVQQTPSVLPAPRGSSPPRGATQSFTARAADDEARQTVDVLASSVRSEHWHSGAVTPGMSMRHMRGGASSPTRSQSSKPRQIVEVPVNISRPMVPGSGTGSVGPPVVWQHPVASVSGHVFRQSSSVGRLPGLEAVPPSTAGSMCVAAGHPGSQNFGSQQQTTAGQAPPPVTCVTTRM